MPRHQMSTDFIAGGGALYVDLMLLPSTRPAVMRNVSSSDQAYLVCRFISVAIKQPVCAAAYLNFSAWRVR
ncbi:hypothetical protein KCP75_08290 [Salmonella enterica subsp. enterica]|nr:hypothetical protein KCP75_08290 [Salmonella enterica subsp. enterica]